MRIRRTIWVLVLAVLGLAAGTEASAQIASVGDGGPGPAKTQHLTAELVSLGPAIAPGGTQEVGLVLTIEEKWHVYWINPGDSGEPPHITWTLAAWRLRPGDAVSDSGAVAAGAADGLQATRTRLRFQWRSPPRRTLKPGPVHLDAQVTWLVCANVCLPGKAHLGLDLMVQPGAPGGRRRNPPSARWAGR